jgi:ATP-binding cassette subfamily B protein
MKLGTMTALVESSGSRKPTITRLIASFWDVDKGQIAFGGIPLPQIRTEESLNWISVVFQDVFLFHGIITHGIALGRLDMIQKKV